MNIIYSNRFLFKLVVIASILSAHVIYAQGEDASSNATYNFRKGLWALQFNIQHYFTIRSFQGGTISAKYHTSDKSAIRFGFTVRGEYASGKEETENEIDDHKYHYESLTFNLQYVRYPSVDKRAKFFYGFGPLITGHHRSILQPEKSRTYNIGAGLTIVLGVEYIISSHLGLTAEYNTSALYMKYYYRINIGNSMQKEHTDRIIIDADDVKFGVSVYL